MERCGLALSVWGQETVVGCCEHSNESLHCVEDGEYFN
jgi:hypothetical protein